MPEQETARPGFLERLKKSRALKISQAAWLVLVACFVAWYFSRNFAELSRYAFHPRLGWLAAALALATLRRLIGGIRCVDIALYPSTPWTRRNVFGLLSAYFISGLAVYIPGNVWFIANRIYLTQKQGLTTMKSSLALAYEMGLNAWTALVLGSFAGIGLLVKGKLTLGFLLAAFVVLSFFLFHEKTVNAVLVRVNRRLRRPHSPVSIKPVWASRVLGWSFLLWTVGGLSLVCVLKAFCPEVPANPVYVTSALSLAWVIGFLTPWAPSGLGIQEGLLVWFLSAYPAPVPLIAAVCLRLMYVFEDVFWASLVLMFGNRQSLKRT
ncbi:MAG: hypothetical protein AB1921_03235 [Thermodesulfobacteriota bacterium]